MTDKTVLRAKSCKPCEGGVTPLGEADPRNLLLQIKEWNLDSEGKSIHRAFRFKTFRDAQCWLNRVADLAEEEGHHPDVTWNYNRIKIELSTHSIGGLSENDFILAAKIDSLQ